MSAISSSVALAEAEASATADVVSRFLLSPFSLQTFKEQAPERPTNSL
jgi:hypothetical protein